MGETRSGGTPPEAADAQPSTLLIAAAAVVLLLLIWLRRAHDRRARNWRKPAKPNEQLQGVGIDSGGVYRDARDPRCSPGKLYSPESAEFGLRARNLSRDIAAADLSSAEAAAEAAELLRQQAAERQQRLLDRAQAEEARQRAEAAARQQQRMEEILSPAAKEVFRTGSNDSNDDLPLPPWDPNAPVPQKPRRAPSLGNMFKRK